MNPFTAIVAAIAVCGATTLICISLVVLAFGHVQNDRNLCYAANAGRECALMWEPV